MIKAKILSLPHKRFLAGLVILVSVLSILKVSAIAQQAGQGLEVSPPSQEVQVDPGTTTQVKASIRNKSTNTTTMSVRVEDFTAYGDEGQVELTNNPTYSIKNWTKVSPSTFTLAPGQEQQVTATVSVPKSAAGGRYGTFVFGVNGSPSKPGTASINQEIASLFLLRISGPVNEKLSLLEFSAPTFSEFGPINFGLKVNNGGNVHVKTYGLINVTDMFNRKVKDVVVYETNVFPGSNRIVTGTLNNRFLIGRYNATAVLYYGSEKNQTITSTLTFYVFPVKIFAGIIVILVILYLGRKRLKKAFKALKGK